MPGGIFICYRREDSSGYAGRIYDRLTQRLGAENVFIDVDNIDPGVDWVEALSERVGACDALVAVIGRNWNSIVDKDNSRRLDDPEDFVRVEIEAALGRDVRVIPVLIDGAAMPKANDLPDGLKKLVRRQHIEIAHTRFDSDVDRLTRTLASILENLRQREAADIERAAREERERQEAGARGEEARRLAKEEAARRAEEERAERAKVAERAETHALTATSPVRLKATRLWDPHGSPPVFVALEGHWGVISAAFSPDGTHVVTASDDKTARVWDLRQKEPSFVALEGHQDWVVSAAFSPDGTHVLTASDDKTARVWDLRQKQPTFVALEGHQGGGVSA